MCTTSIPPLQRRVIEHLEVIYPGLDLDKLSLELIAAMGLLPEDIGPPSRNRNLWDQSDSLLITYGNSIVSEGEKPLKTLKRFMDQHLQGAIKGVHILPFCPYSSDDGFSVIDYMKVNPELGDWDDVSAIAEDYDLMADMVINHASSQSEWFDNFKKRQNPGKDYFFEANPEDDLSEVVRPRASPLLTKVDTVDGERHVWCTFSADQVDLNFKNPELLKEIVTIFRQYLERGARIFRLDAVAFLWKEVGTTSIHLQQTHELIKLLRTLIEHYNHNAIVITETNVPNRENLTYFGNANEAHMIYNFSLPPLLLYTLLSGDCRHMKTWMMSMPPAQAGTTYFNFIASHDGIGLRPLDGLVADDDREAMVNTVKTFGGKVTYRKSKEGNKPYEINVALFDALKGTMEGGEDQWQLQRFMCAHKIMLALEGVPALYIHSLLATGNDYEGVERTGVNRSINRHVWSEDELDAALADNKGQHCQVFDELRKLLAIRREQPAFHPNATQFTMHLGTKVFAFWRQSIAREQSIFCLSNITLEEQVINLSDINLIGTDKWVDLSTGERITDLDGQIALEPYQSMWISNWENGAAVA